MTASAHTRTPARTWASFHVHVSSSPTAVDELLRALPGILGSPTGDRRWFFLRYWTGGTHVRLRVEDPPPELVDHLAGALRSEAEAIDADAPIDPALYEVRAQRAAEGGERFPSTVQDHATVLLADYEPEVERYGGDHGIPVAEDAFCASSALVLQALAHERFERRNAGVNVVLGAVHALRDAGLDPVRFVMRYLVSWQTIWPGERSRATELASTWWTPMATPDGSPPTGLRRAAAELFGAYLEAATAARAGTDDYGPDDILVSQVHMTLNRLGLSVSEEHLLLFMALPYAVKLDHQAGTKHFLPWEERLGAYPGRTYARPTGAVEPFAATGARPEPGTAAAAIAERQSPRDFSNAIDPAELQSLFELGFGAHQMPGYRHDDGQVYPQLRRGYPSAGILFPVIARVAIGESDGLAPGLYEYHPEAAGFEQIFDGDEVDISLAAIRYCLPREFVGPPAAVLWLCGFMPDAHIRYRAKGDRFVHLETGHLTQNLLLVGTELGLAMRPVGGFYDHLASLAAGVDGSEINPIYAVLLGGKSS